MCLTPLTAKILDSSYQLVIVGKIDKKLKEKLPSNIICIDRTNNVKELVEIYSVADLFINTTLEDNFPTVNLEALACGTPVISFDTGGCSETVKNTCGVIVEKEDFKALVKIIKKIRIKDSNNIIIENNCINLEKCIEESRTFDKKEKYNEYINIFKEVLLFNTVYKV